MISSTERTQPRGWAEEPLRRITEPIRAEMLAVEMQLERSLGADQGPVIWEIMASLRHSSGKRLRPSLVLLASRAARGRRNGHPGSDSGPVPIAVAVELIHVASLVHDDLIDAAPIRHHRSSINARWGGGISVALGDYLCAIALQLVAEYGDPRVFHHLGSGLCAMCEGEIAQVMGRGDLATSEEACLAIVEKKTAALFAACCAGGAATAVDEAATQEHLRQFGFHFGIAFQILDDCKDLLGDETTLGKRPAQDLLAGDVTLPLLFFLEERGHDSADLGSLFTKVADAAFLDWVKRAFRASEAGARTAQIVRLHTERAKEALGPIADSDAKRSLGLLADYLGESISEILAR
jgi:geranylgeranyl pyrophosphate synthase